MLVLFIKGRIFYCFFYIILFYIKQNIKNNLVIEIFICKYNIFIHNIDSFTINNNYLTFKKFMYFYKKLFNLKN
jgi:hypothetical protein